MDSLPNEQEGHEMEGFVELERGEMRKPNANRDRE